MHTKSRSFTAFAAAGLALAGLGVVPASADTTPVVSTTTQHGSFTITDASDLCTGEPIVINVIGNMAFHVAVFPNTASTFPGVPETRGTFTTEGTASFLQTSSGLTYSGRLTFWDNFILNSKNAVGVVTATLDLTAVDSSGNTHVETGHLTSTVAYNATDRLSPS